MRKYYILLFFLLGIILIPNIQAQDINQKLFELPDVIFKEIKSTSSYQHTYELRVKQPVDHLDLSKGYFYQKVYLSHKGFKKPFAFQIIWKNRLIGSCISRGRILG